MGMDAHNDHITFHPSGDLASTKRLLAYGDDVNHKGELHSTPLMQAARSGDVESVKLLLDNHADMEAADDSGRTALNWSLFMYKLSRLPSYTAICKLLIDRGTKLDHRDRQGRTYLMSALDIGNAEIARAIIAHGADVNLADSNGHTALMYAVRGALSAADTGDICKKLLDNHANREAKNVHGKTALDLARGQSDKEIRAAGVKALTQDNAP